MGSSCLGVEQTCPSLPEGLTSVEIDKMSLEEMVDEVLHDAANWIIEEIADAVLLEPDSSALQLTPQATTM